MLLIKTEDDLWDYCGSFYLDLLKFVESLPGNNRWWFEEGYWNKRDDSYSMFFKSYITPEYKNFSLSIHVRRINDKYEFKVLKQNTELS